MTTMADKLREMKKPDYETPNEFYDLVLAIDGAAYTMLHRKIAIHFSDGSVYEMDGLFTPHSDNLAPIPVSRHRPT